MQAFQNPVARTQTDNILTLEPASPSPRTSLKQHNDHIRAWIDAGCKENGWTPPTGSGMIEMVPPPLSPLPLEVCPGRMASFEEISLEEITPPKTPGQGTFVRRMLRTCLMTSKLSMRDHRTDSHADMRALRVLNTAPQKPEEVEPIVDWMWGDAGTRLTHGIAQMNPLRWSSGPRREIVDELLIAIANGVRPVELRLKGHKKIHHFENQTEALNWLRYLGDIDKE